jgi:hypothetical protein
MISLDPLACRAYGAHAGKFTEDGNTSDRGAARETSECFGQEGLAEDASAGYGASVILP